MSFCFLYNVVLENFSVQNSPWGEGGLLPAQGLKSSIFTSGFATREILLLVFMSGIKIDLPLKKVKFSVSFML